MWNKCTKRGAGKVALNSTALILPRNSRSKMMSEIAEFRRRMPSTQPVPHEPHLTHRGVVVDEDYKDDPTTSGSSTSANFTDGYKCPECDRTFNREDMLARHTKAVHKPTFFQCKHCRMYLRNHRELATHLKNHPNETPKHWPKLAFTSI
jgi:hypothetical protein